MSVPDCGVGKPGKVCMLGNRLRRWGTAWVSEVEHEGLAFAGGFEHPNGEEGTGAHCTSLRPQPLVYQVVQAKSVSG